MILDHDTNLVTVQKFGIDYKEKKKSGKFWWRRRVPNCEIFYCVRLD